MAFCILALALTLTVSVTPVSLFRQSILSSLPVRLVSLLVCENMCVSVYLCATFVICVTILFYHLCHSIDLHTARVTFGMCMCLVISVPLNWSKWACSEHGTSNCATLYHWKWDTHTEYALHRTESMPREYDLKPSPHHIQLSWNREQQINANRCANNF